MSRILWFVAGLLVAGGVLLLALRKLFPKGTPAGDFVAARMKEDVGLKLHSVFSGRATGPDGLPEYRSE